MGLHSILLLAIIVHTPCFKILANLERVRFTVFRNKNE